MMITETQQFWNIFLETLSQNKRGNDILGFLEHENGIGLLLLDSKLDGWTRLAGRFIRTASKHDFEIMNLVFENNVKPIVYPSCIQDIQVQESQKQEQ